MKPILLYLFLLFSLWSCQECDFSIPQEQRDFFSYYSVGDTIYFESEKDIDTITVVSIDSIETCNSFMTPPYKYLFVQVKHLPSDKWSPMTSYRDQEGNLRKSYQSIFFLDKDLSKSESTYFIEIDFRDFSAFLHDSCLVENDYLKDLGVSRYWKMRNEAAYSNQNDSSTITSLIYTKEFGVTEYTKLNGEKLRIKNP